MICVRYGCLMIGVGRVLAGCWGELSLSSVGKKLFLPWKETFPPLEILFSSLGKFIFLPWKVLVPPLELFSSKAGFFLELVTASSIGRYKSDSAGL